MTSIPTDLAGCLELLPDNTDGAITAEAMRAIVTCEYNEMEALEADVSTNRDDIALNRSDLDSVKAQADESSTAIVTLGQNMDSLFTQIQNVANQLANTQILVQQNADAIGNLQGDVGGLVATVTDLQQRVDALEAAGP